MLIRIRTGVAHKNKSTKGWRKTMHANLTAVIYQDTKVNHLTPAVSKHVHWMITVTDFTDKEVKGSHPSYWGNHIPNCSCSVAFWY